MKILIIGGTGLISTGISRILMERGDDLTLYNRGRSPVRLARQPAIILGDRTDFPAFEAQMAELGEFDCVIDMVCFHPDEAESAVRAFRGRTSHYVFCSTVDVYTKPADRYPITEDAERQPSPSFPYAYDKAACERVLFAAWERGDLPVTAIRPALTYGEGGRLVHTFGFETYVLDRISRGLPVVAHGDGRSFWSVCHRDDVAGGFVGAVDNPDTVGKGYHVTGEEWLTWDRYYQGMAAALDVDCPRLVHIPTDLLGQALPERANWCVENFSYNNIFDNTSAHRDLGFEYTIPYLDGFERTVNWLVDHDQIERAEDYPFYDRLLAAWDELEQGLIDEMKG